jgi:hypothetical protein
MEQIEICRLAVRVAYLLLCAALVGGCSLLTVILTLYRRTRCLTARLAFEQQRRIAEANETWRIASTAYAAAEPVTLEDLLSSAERDFSLRSSKK